MKSSEIHQNRVTLIAFLKQRHRHYDAVFNRSVIENKSDKWRLLRVEKIIKLLDATPDYQLGQCFTCGNMIPPKRLQLDPETIWCASCVEEHEKQTGNRGGHWWIPKKSGLSR